MKPCSKGSCPNPAVLSCCDEWFCEVHLSLHDKYTHSYSLVCEVDWEVIDEQGNEHYRHCAEQAVVKCCGVFLCLEHMKDHEEYAHRDCPWCKGTKVMSGQMLNSRYAGPCLVCCS